MGPPEALLSLPSCQIPPTIPVLSFHLNPLQGDKLKVSPLRIRECLCVVGAAPSVSECEEEKQGKDVGPQTRMNASVSTAAHTIAGKQSGQETERQDAEGSKRAFSDHLRRGWQGGGVFLQAHGPHVALVQQFQRSHADATALSVMKHARRIV